MKFLTALLLAVSILVGSAYTSQAAITPNIHDVSSSSVEKYVVRFIPSKISRGTHYKLQTVHSSILSPKSFDRTCLQSNEFDTGWSDFGNRVVLNGVDFSSYNTCQADAVSGSWRIPYAISCPNGLQGGGNGEITQGQLGYIPSGVRTNTLFSGSIFAQCFTVINGKPTNFRDPTSFAMYFSISGILSSGQSTFDTTPAYWPW